MDGVKFDRDSARRTQAAVLHVEGTSESHSLRPRNPRHPRSSPAPTVLLGQTTAAVTSGDATFTIDNIAVVQGTDPRPTPVSAAQAITVKNTFSLDIDDNTLVRAEQNKMGEWETVRPGEGTDPPVIVRFELTADLALAATSAAAILLNDDGSTPGSATAITVTDTNGHFSGLATYTDAEDNTQPGFRGTAIKYIDPGPVDRYYIVDIERLFPKAFVTLNETVGSATGPFHAEFKKGYGNNYRIPPRASTSTIDVYNTDHFADGAANGSDWIAFYDPVADKYELFVGSPESNPAIIKATTDSTVVASDATFPASVSGDYVVRGDVPRGSGGSAITSFTVTNDPPCEFGNGDVVYLSYNELLGAGDVALAFDTGDARNFLAHLRGIGEPEGDPWDATKPQRVEHHIGENPKWVEVCTEDFVTQVLVNVAGDELQYKKRPWDSCVVTTTKVDDVEEC